MAFGFQVLNADGHVQVDESFRNLVVVASGSGSASPRFNFNTATFASQSTCPPLIFVRPASTGIEVGRAQFGQYAPPYTSFLYEATGNFDWKLCGLDSQPAVSGTHGLQVFNASGAVTYDSRLPYMQVKSLHRLYQQFAASVTVTVPDQGEAPWFLLNYLCPSHCQTGAYGPFLGFSGQLLSNTQIKVRCMNDDIYSADWDAPGAQDNFIPCAPPLIVMSARF